MNQDLTEEEMRRALFGEREQTTECNAPPIRNPISDTMVPLPGKVTEKRKATKAFTPRLLVTLRVGNEFEGETHEVIHHADTLSTLLAEQEAVRLAKKKFRFVEVVSIKSM